MEVSIIIPTYNRKDLTQRAIRSALAQVGVLPTDQSSDLLDAYRFLRRTEHRLQMEAERQTHRLPKDRRALERIPSFSAFQTNTDPA